ncbi:hypothetical protein K6T82_11175 [Flavobacterium sp. 17A]|uniref:Uncharacterized protein n=2 Tax=Flavobacterium TaxID=237 RepID=A0A9X1HBC0_9FLAO|nr:MULTISPECIES: hypothetical protein [Flavobacterium]NWL01803.1 hypothetical protein [Flavobacterium collinsii]MBW1656116.1 hypothetical protein [Flavobacterium quisquiliarum]MBZ4035329.1 hypothetical protein [Flavobacterium potami]RXM49572.1 hypothetical protein BOW55_00600 [Flavobacterium sp. YO12]WET02951.1 hypothetical protein P0R33_01200 [Flavobacterium sp. YJ01]
MGTSSIIQEILQILSVRYGMSCSLEELSQLIGPAVDTSKQTSSGNPAEKEKQALILETLILLHDRGLIFLDSATDRSVITIKGLLKIHNSILCN